MIALLTKHMDFSYKSNWTWLCRTAITNICCCRKRRHKPRKGSEKTGMEPELGLVPSDEFPVECSGFEPGLLPDELSGPSEPSDRSFRNDLFKWRTFDTSGGSDGPASADASGVTATGGQSCNSGNVWARQGLSWWQKWWCTGGKGLADD
ncbi:hypothetical protein CDL15_Pgr007349 [Punica granatum]|nr:hypothetical protein CDL15_Pgr007349 [Punica granatum]